MVRAAVAEAMLSMARAAWGELVRQREQGRGRRPSEEKVRAAEKAMARADEALSRALADLRSALPPAPKQSAAEREAVEFAQVVRASTTKAPPAAGQARPDGASAPIIAQSPQPAAGEASAPRGVLAP